MNWFMQYGAAHFATTLALQLAFLARFKKEKTPSDIRKKLEKLKQKDLLVEDFAQKFMDLNGRLVVNERPTNETLGEWFCKGLRKEIRTSVASQDFPAGAGGLNNLVATAIRSEKRLGQGRSKNKTYLLGITQI